MSAYNDLILATNPADLVGYWPLDELAGATVAVNLAPITGSAANGTEGDATVSPAQISPTLGVAPLISTGKAAQFDGSSTAISVEGNSPADNASLFAGNGSWACSCWCKTSQAGAAPVGGQYQYSFSMAHIVCNSDANRDIFLFRISQFGKLEVLAWYGGGGNSYVSVIGSVTINDGVKHHLAASFDSPGLLLTIYVDGVADGTGATPSGGRTSGVPSLTFGAELIGGVDYGHLDGVIDEIALWRTPLTPAQVTTITTQGNATPPPALIPSDPGDPGLSGSLAQLRMQLEDGRDLTPLWESANFTTLAIGGFGSLEFALEGWRQRDEVPKLMLVRVTYGPELLWEGRIEDVAYTMTGGTPDSPGDLQTLVSCYGLKRLLDDDTERQIWSIRDINWKPNQSANGYVMGLETKTKELDVQTGAFDPTDLTKGGVQIQGGGVSIGASRGNGAEIILPQGMTAKRIRGIVALSGANTGAGKLVGLVEWSDAISGSYIWVSSIYRAAGPAAVNEDLSTPSNTIIVRLSGYNEGGGALTPTATDLVSFYNLRILCTALNEDTTLSTVNGSGGFYGGTLMRQVIALVAGLKQGTIEDATEFVIDQLERQVRGTATSLIEEISQYSARQWAVWEDGAFDWKSINFDEPQWIVPVEACSGLDITSSVEGQAKRTVILYTDPATGLTAEQSAFSTDGRNPFVKYQAARDYTLDNGAMTANTAAQLAAKINTNDVGTYTPASGHITIPALTILPSAHGGHGLPACCIRAGCNVTIPGLPKSDPFDTGRDGETLFHVVTSTVDLGEGTVTLELENSTRRTEALLARLAAVTQRLTRF